MDHQQSTILAMTETAKEASRAHIEMHNQIVALQSEVARLREKHPLELILKLNESNARIAELTALTQECCDHIGDRYPDDQVMRRRIKKIVGESS